MAHLFEPAAAAAVMPPPPLQGGGSDGTSHPATNATLIGALSNKRTRIASLVSAPPPHTLRGSYDDLLCQLGHRPPPHCRRRLHPSFATLCPPLSHRHPEDALRAVGQAHARLGTPDPRLTAQGTLDFRLTSLFQAWQRTGAPPSRVKPLPLGLVSQVWALAQGEATPVAIATAQCLIIGFYFLLRPGEYLGQPHTQGSHLFRLCDIQFWIGSRAHYHLACPDDDLRAATFATLTFTQQKNGVRNERIGHGRSGHPSLCPVAALTSRAVALRAQEATATATLNAVRPHAHAPFQYISPTDITTRIRSKLHFHPDPAYTVADVSVRSTRAGGAMALLCAGVDSDRIRMVGRWRSDEMYRYLHVQAQPIMTGLSAAMLRGSSFRLTPG